MTDETTSKRPAPPLSDAVETELADLYERALAAEKSGAVDAAATLYRRMTEIDPDDRAGASVRLAALGAEASPEIAPPAYVAMLFDQHAEVFDGMLVEQLGYDAPLRIGEMARAFVPIGKALDLGCGTGLVGEALRDLTAELTGVDLSEGMLDVAHEKEVYDSLYIADASAFLLAPPDESPGPWDLITAADVLPYVGELTEFFDGLAACAAPGGRVVLTTESGPDDAFGAQGWMVGPKHRFAHAESYVRAQAERVSLSVREMAPLIVRYDEGAPVGGHLVLLENAKA